MIGKFSEEHKKRISVALRSNKNGIGHKLTPDKLIRNSMEYKLWRKAVFERDRWTCIWCGYKGSKIQADHIKRFSEFPELRFAIDNGRTLCGDCHRKTHNWGNPKKYDTV